MGMLARWGLVRDAATSAVVLPETQGDVAQAASLPADVAAAFGINLQSDRVTRDQAMTIPSMRRGRQIIAGTLGTAPLTCMRRRAGKAPDCLDLPLFAQPDPNTTRAFMLTWTADDLLFHGVSWWLVLERGTDGFPTKARRVEPGRVSVDTASGKVRIDGQLVADRDVIRFDGPDEGVLKHGARTLRTALMLEEAVRRYARLDVPLGLIEDSLGHLEASEVQTLLDAWEVARQQRTTGYLPNGLSYKPTVFDATQVQLAEARAYQSAEIARLLNLPPSAVNAPSNDSLTYSTTESHRRELVDLTFAPFIAAIEQRLSMNDVTPRGTTVHVDLTAFLRGDLTSVLNAAKVGIDAGILSAEEVRANWLNLPPIEESSND